MKLKSSFPSDKDLENLALTDIINGKEIQLMMDNFYRIAKIPMSITDMEGKVLVGVGWQDICTKFHRQNSETCKNCIESDLNLTDGIRHDEFKLYKCKNGMWDMATPLIIGEKRMGNLFIGQFFFKDEIIDFDYFLSQAAKYNFNKTEYIKALRRVPRLCREDLESAKAFFVILAHSLSQLGYSNIQLARSIQDSAITAKSLAESKAHLERSQEIAHLGSWELDLINNKLTWSAEAYRIFGVPPGEFKATYEAFLETIHPEDREIVENAYSSSLKENRDIYEIEHRVVRKNTGEILFVHEKCEHFRDSEGRIIRSVGMVHDITDRKKAEKELLESKEKLNIALESGNIGAWELNLATKEFIFDKRMENIFGIEPGSFRGTYDDFERYLNEEDIPHLKKSFDKTLEEGTPFETVFRIKNKNEEEKYVNAKATLKKDDRETPLKITGVCFDITEMKRGAEKVLFELHEELMRSNSELEQFAYIASHDLQEPLRMVTSFTQLLSERYKDKLGQEGQEFIDFAVDGAMRMQNQILDLLALSRIQTTGNKFSSVNMQLILDHIIKNLNLSIQEKGAIIKSQGMTSIMADEGQMTQLMQNLIENSLKYSTKPPRIHISCEELDGFHQFAIKDNGIGIEQQYLDRIFKIFQRLHPKALYVGNGIGLAICKRIVERHKGKIWAESELGAGSSFYFTIPKI